MTNTRNRSKSRYCSTSGCSLTYMHSVRKWKWFLFVSSTIRILKRLNHYFAVFPSVQKVNCNTIYRIDPGYRLARHLAWFWAWVRAWGPSVTGFPPRASTDPPPGPHLSSGTYDYRYYIRRLTADFWDRFHFMLILFWHQFECKRGRIQTFFRSINGAFTFN